jgi:hypothetical protein
MSEPVDVDARVAEGARAADEILAARSEAQLVGAAERKGTLVAEGDSWFDYPLRDVLSVLEDQGWDVESVAHRGDNVESMAYDDSQRDGLRRAFEKVARRDETPKALLLSGGGNDFAGPELAVLLDHVRSGFPPINEAITDELVNRRILAAWATLIGFTSTLSQGLFEQKTPTFIHGYDYSVPDGRGFGGGFLGGFGPLPGPWLAPSFDRKGIKPMEGGRELTVDLLDRYNEMLSGLADRPGFEHVTYIDLRRTLHSSDYKDDWANELHPTRDGFARIAGVIDEAISG